MAWVESHQSIGHHPKTKRAAKMLGISVAQMVGHLHLLWHWTWEFAESGDLTEYELGIISDGAQWEGDPESFVNALLTCRVKPKGSGFLDRTPDGRLIVHDWADYTGRLLAIREQNRVRQQRFRHASRVTNALVTSENAQCNVSNGLTKPNITKPNITKPIESPLLSPHEKAILPADETMMMDSLMVLRQWGATKEEAEDAIRRFPDKPPKYLKAVIQTARDNHLNGAPASVSTAHKETATDRSIARLIAAGKVKPHDATSH